MDVSEYKIINFQYNEIEKRKIEMFNTEHLNMALNLLKSSREKILYDRNYKSLSDLDKIKLWQEHNDYKLFCKLYPVVSKYIILLGLFSSKAFKKYLDWKSKVRPNDEYRTTLIENPRAQRIWYNKYWYAVYIKYLYQEKNKHSNTNELQNIYNTTINELNNETNKFYDIYDVEMNKIENNEKKYSECRKEELKKQINEILNKQMTEPFI